MSSRLNFQQLFAPSRWSFLSSHRRKNCVFAASSALAIALTASLDTHRPARAATINRTFVGGEQPIGSRGDGRLPEIFDAAAGYWEAAILDDLEVSIDFGWGNLPDTTLAEFTLLTVTGTPERASEGSIFFNNNTRLFNWFLDATPTQNEEFSQFTAFSEDFGGGEINTGRIYSNANDTARNQFDLLTIAIHEMGHAFGILNFYEDFDKETLDDDIDISRDLPFSGSQIPTTPINGGHLDIETAALTPFFRPGRRILLSEVDILAAAASTGSRQLNLNPQISPPQRTPDQTSAFTALLFITGGMNWLKRRQSKFQSG